MNAIRTIRRAALAAALAAALPLGCRETPTAPRPDPQAVILEELAREGLVANDGLALSGHGSFLACVLREIQRRQPELQHLGFLQLIAEARDIARTCTAPSPPPPPPPGPQPGSIKVTTQTGGQNLDPDGYQVTFDGGGGIAIGVNDTKTRGGLSPGDHAVELTGVANDCTVGGQNPRTVTVPDGGQAPTTFDVTCQAPPPPPPPMATGVIVFTSERDGNPEIYSMNPDGSNPTRLTTAPAGDFEPSLEAGRIAFLSQRDGRNEIYIMNLDGSGQTRLTFSTASDGSPALSPDGSRVAFVSNRADPAHFEIWVMDSDGSNPTRLTTSGDNFRPAWSPDGTKIVYAHSPGQGLGDIHVMNADGSGDAVLTSGADDSAPEFSPDGTKIVFHSDRAGNREIYRMDADGSNIVRLTNDPADDHRFPSYSPDGSRISYERSTGNREVFAIDADGSNPTNLTSNPALDYFPDWGP